jgi:hypothetical protein
MSDDHLEYTNLNYRNLLLSTIAVLLVVNTYFLFSGSWLALVPIVLQSAILITYRLKWSEQRYLIRFWAGLLFVAGAAGLLGTCAKALNTSAGGTTYADESLLGWGFVLNVIQTIAGVYFFVALTKSTRVVEDTSENTSDSPRAD